MPSDDRLSRERVVRSPHPATVSRGRAVQPKLSKEAVPHPATLSARSAVRTRASSAGHPATVAQPKKLGKMRAGMQSGKANPANKNAKQASKADRSFNNLKDYRPLWVTQNGITALHVRDFVKSYKWGIRGHASGDNSQGEQGNTTEDCKAYKGWHTRLHGWH